MNILPPPPPPPLSTFQPPTTTLTTNVDVNASPSNHHHHSSSTSSPPTSSAIIVMIVISSAIIISATVYLLLRRCNRTFRTTSSPTDDVVSTNQTAHVPHHVLPVTTNTTPNSLPLFTFASLTGKITGGDCAVCLSKFAGADLLRLLPLCCHAFHVDCIDVWLRSNHTCPLCRSTVNPTDEDILNTLSSGGNRSNSFRIEIGSFSRRRDPSSMSDRRSYSVGSYDYVLDDGYEIPVESTHRSVVSDCGSVDKDSAAPAESAVAEVAAGGGSGRRNWLRDYVDRFSTSLSLRGSGRFFAGSSRRSEGVSEFEGSHGRIGEEISELFRWFSGV